MPTFPIIISGTESIGNSLSSINLNAQNFDTRITSIEGSFSNLGNRVVALENITNNEGYFIQQIRVDQSLPEVGTTQLGVNTIASVGLPDITITRKKTNSKLLIELTGGMYKNTTAHTIRTFFTNDLNLNLIGAPVGVVNHNAGGDIFNSHKYRALFTPTQQTTVVRVRAQISTAGSLWNAVSIAQIPFTFTVTEVV